MRKFYSLSAIALSAMTALANVGDLPLDPSTVMIKDPVPGATPEIFVKSGTGFLSLGEGNGLDVFPSEGSLSKIVRDGDKLYISNVFSWASSPGWIEGTVTGDQVSFKFPQLINEYDEDNGIITRHRFYAVVCKMVVRGDQADMVPTAEQTLNFTINPDGSLTPELTSTGESYFLGNWEFADRTWTWNLDGDFYTLLAPQTEKTIDAPASIEYKPMVLTYPHILYGGAYANEVYVGFDGDDCYLKGIALGISDLPDATIKGTRDGKVIRFDSDQFLGDSWLFGFTQYLIGGETEFVEDPYYGIYSPVFNQTDCLEFVYDEETSTMTSDMSFIIVPSIQEDAANLYYENIYNTPSIFPLNTDTDITALSAPEVLSYEADDAYGLHIVQFAGSMISADDQLLDMSKLYFQFLTDGAPLEFTKEMDPYLKTPASLIPFGTTDYGCFIAQENIVQMVAIPMSVKFNTLKLRYVYDPEGASPIYSDAVTIAEDAAVDEINADNEVVGTSFTDLGGRPVANPENGVYIRTVRMADGSLRHQKVLINSK